MSSVHRRKQRLPLGGGEAQQAVLTRPFPPQAHYPQGICLVSENLNRKQTKPQSKSTFSGEGGVAEPLSALRTFPRFARRLAAGEYRAHGACLPALGVRGGQPVAHQSPASVLGWAPWKVATSCQQNPTFPNACCASAWAVDHVSASPFPWHSGPGRCVQASHPGRGPRPLSLLHAGHPVPGAAPRPVCHFQDSGLRKLEPSTVCVFLGGNNWPCRRQAAHGMSAILGVANHIPTIGTRK